MYPQLLATDAGVRVLTEEDPTYLAELKVQFVSLASVLDDWISKIEQLESVSRKNVPAVGLTKIDAIVAAKASEESALADPSVEIWQRQRRGRNLF